MEDGAAASEEAEAVERDEVNSEVAVAVATVATAVIEVNVVIEEIEAAGHGVTLEVEHVAVQEVAVVVVQEALPSTPMTKRPSPAWELSLTGYKTISHGTTCLSVRERFDQAMSYVESGCLLNHGQNKVYGGWSINQLTMGLMFSGSSKKHVGDISSVSHSQPESESGSVRERNYSLIYGSVDTSSSILLALGLTLALLVTVDQNFLSLRLL